MRHFPRLLLTFGVFCAIESVVCAQPCLVQGDPGPLALETFAGTVQPEFAVVQPANRITVVLLTGAFPAADRAVVEKQLTALYRGADKNAVLALVVSDGTRFTAPDSARTPAAWQKLIHDSWGDDSAGTALPAEPFYAALAEGMNSWGGEWSNLLLVGLPGDADPALRDYALPWLRAQVCRQKLRISYWNPDGRTPEFWTALAAATSGASNPESPAEFAQWAASGSFREAAWPAPPIDRGFVAERGKFRSAELPLLEPAPGALMLSFEQYTDLRRTTQEAGALAKQEQLDAAQVQRIRELLQHALTLNPLDPEALRAGADYYARFKDPKTAAQLLGSLALVRPHDAKLAAEQGHALFLAGDVEAAEKPLLRAREAGVPGTSEELARIHLARHDDAGALPYLDDALATGEPRADLWFARADLATRLQDWSKTADSLEKGLAVEKGNFQRRTALVTLYMEHGPADRALPHVQLVASALPAEASVRRQYAGFLEKLHRPDEALTLWKKTLEADPKMEEAHFRVARLLLDSGKLPDSLAASETGIAADPKSARLRVLKSDVLERQGQFYAARDALRVAAKTAQDPELLARLAEMEDISGSQAAHAYAAALAAQASPALLQRALEVALRDGDLKSAADFRARLTAAGNSGGEAWFLARNDETQTTATVPGGLEALAFIAHMQHTAPQRFFEEYCRTLVDRTTTADPKQGNLYLEGIREYFERLASLKALGTAKGSHVEVVISRADKAATQRTGKILDLLGWTLHTGKEGVRLEAGEKGSQAKRQEMASALAVSQTDMQEALQANRPFTFTIDDETAPVVLGDAKWLATFFPKEKLGGGMAEMLAREVRVAKIYAALSAMGPRAVALLVPGTDLKQLADKHADLLYRRASAFALHGVHAAVPGGPAAEASWEKMLEAPPSNPGRFFRSLLEKDDGKLLAFFDLLAQLDSEHQRFFTLSLDRMKRFYEVFRESPDVAQGAAHSSQNSPYVEFLREIPLDHDLHVLFPGSPEVWQLAKGKSSNAGASKMVKKLARITAPDQEDTILIRILRMRYSMTGAKLSESDNFVAVVRIDQHRDDPLDEASALLLAQHYAVAGTTYPYFASLTELGEPQFTRFFRIVDQVQSLPKMQLNLLLGHLHSLIELLALGQETGALDGKAAAELFGSLCDRFASASSAADYSIASLAAVRGMLARLPAKDAADPDLAIQHMLLGAPAPVEFDLGGERRSVDPVTARAAAYRKVLAEQKVTSFKTLLECDRLLTELSAGKAPGDNLKALAALDPLILSVPVPKEMKASEADRRVMSDHERDKIPEILQHLTQQFARKKVNLEDVKKLRVEFLSAISQTLKVSLSGVIYAYFLDPADLLVSEDPLLIRKHRFLDTDTNMTAIFPPSDFNKGSQGAGSHLIGGFAQFFNIAGQFAVSGEKTGNNTMVAAAQIGSLRATDWRRVNETDLRVLGLRIRLAREWVLHAALDAKLADALAEDTLGLLSATRRARLLDAISSRDWSTALTVATLGDLYSLSGRYLERFQTDSWQSPVLAALRRMPAEDDARMRWFGGSAVDLMGCAHPHLAELGPYELYEWLLLPQKLSQRTAEFKLFLADVAGRVGVPPAILGTVAEPLAKQILGKAHMADLHDWRSVTQAFGGLGEDMLEAALDSKQ